MQATPSHLSPERTSLDARPPLTWRLRTRTLDTADHTLVMGVVNVTPDSFSDGGVHTAGGVIDHRSAISHGLGLIEAGADIVDVGGESTRPRSRPVAAADEAARVLPIVEALVSEGAVVSIDTTKVEVAAAALEAGAEIVNDVTALADPAMGRLCAESGCAVVLVHMKGTPQTMQDDPRYDDVVTEVATALGRAADGAIEAGVAPDRICVDPGIGFGKTSLHNLELLRSLDHLVAYRRPVLVGASRKGFLGAILEAAGHPAPPQGRDPATLATVALAVASGAAVIRAHDVAGAVQATRTADAIVRTSIRSRS